MVMTHNAEQISAATITHVAEYIRHETFKEAKSLNGEHFQPDGLVISYRGRTFFCITVKKEKSERI